MSGKISISGIRVVMNLLIAGTLIFGFSIVAEEMHQLMFNPETIDILDRDHPWLRPTTDVTLMLDKAVIAEDDVVYETVQQNILMHDILERFLFVVISVLIFFQLKKLLIAINGASFFVRDNYRIIRRLSFLVLLWVGSELLIYELIPVFVPPVLIQYSINFTTFTESVYRNIMSALDFRMLFVAIILYVVAVSFREGTALKEQTDLTI